MLVTTEKDVVRLLAFRPLPIPLAFVPMSIAIEKQDDFDRWLVALLASSREAA